VNTSSTNKTLGVLKGVMSWARSIGTMLVAEDGWEDHVVMRHAGVDKKSTEASDVSAGGLSADHEMAEG